MTTVDNFLVVKSRQCCRFFLKSCLLEKYIISIRYLLVDFQFKTLNKKKYHGYCLADFKYFFPVEYFFKKPFQMKKGQLGTKLTWFSSAKSVTYAFFALLQLH